MKRIKAAGKLLILIGLISVTPRRIFTPNGDGVNDTISIRVQASGSNLRGRIFSLTGRIVAELAFQPPDTLSWNGLDIDGSPAPKGIYIYQIDAGTEKLRGTVVLAR